MIIHVDGYDDDVISEADKIKNAIAFLKNASFNNDDDCYAYGVARFVLDRWLAPEQGQVDNAEYLLRGLSEIREIYCNMEGFIPETAPEGYVLQEIRKMYETAVEFIKGYSELARGKGGR